ncbi:hypothetical protein [Duganella sp. Root198D2]|uniref:hypothetical protein n=1 Tax=Duganella sp. Root198D2 TaxID=1736489 RepID=UPI00070D79F7|nr:hypothetical protein [Duganella sp. Root198D2]
MKEVKAIRAAMLRLTSIEQMEFRYDSEGQIYGDGQIHFLVEVGGQFFLAWEDNETKTMIVNPITRFELDALVELGSVEAWTLLCVPATLAEGIRFREIDNAELNEMYCRMSETANAIAILPFNSVKVGHSIFRA